jgi:adenylyltransferase/sulfurtransferase
VRSLNAAAMLLRLGHARVASLAGGIDRWSLEIDPSLPRY